MKVIPLSEAKAKLSRYGQLCHEPVVEITEALDTVKLCGLD